MSDSAPADPAPPDPRAKLLKKIERHAARIEETKLEKARLKWCIVAGVVLCPIGFFWSWLYALWILAGGLIFWGVGMYLNWGHVKDGQRALDTARMDLERFDKAIAKEAASADQ